MNKQELRDLAPEGYVYGGKWDNHYHFQKGEYTANGGNFLLMSCLPEDLTPENLACMAKHGLTRIIKQSDKD
jgi:hypothetical protein